MNVIDAIKERRSIQNYKDLPLHQDQLFTIINAGSLAPSAGNLQDWRVVIVTDKEKRTKLAHASHHQMWMTSAPVHLVLCADTIRAKQFYQQRGEHLFCTQSVAAAAQNMLLTATHLGLAGTWVGAFEEEEVNKIIEAPDGIRAQIILTLGYANEIKPMPQRQPLEAFAFFEKYNKRVTDDVADITQWDVSKMLKRKTKNTTQTTQSIWQRILRAFK